MSPPEFDSEPRAAAAPPVSRGRRVGWPLWGAAAAVVCLVLGYLAAGVAWLLLQYLAGIALQPLLWAGAVPAGVLVGSALYYPVLRLAGDPAPARSALAIVGGGGVLIAPAGYLGLAADSWNHWAIPAFAALVFLVLRWRATHRPLTVRLPAAAAGCALLPLLLPQATAELHALGYRVLQPATLDTAVLDREGWEPTRVSSDGGSRDDGLRITYRQGGEGAAGPRVWVDTYDPESAGAEPRCDRGECVRREGVRVEYGGSGTVRAYAALDDGRTAVITDPAPFTMTVGELSSLATGLRVSAAADHRWLSRMLTHADDWAIL